MARELKEPFVSASLKDVDTISNDLTENLDLLNDLNQRLEDYEAKLGSKEDSRNMRKRMKDDMKDADSAIKTSIELLKRLKDYPLKNPKDIDQRNKILRRVQEYFNKQNDKFTKLLQSLKAKEKIYVQARQSMRDSRLKGSGASGSMGSGEEEDPELVAQIEDLDFTEAVIREREKDVQDIRRLAHEMNRTAQYQAGKIKETSEDLAQQILGQSLRKENSANPTVNNYVEIVENHVIFTEKQTEQATKELDQAEKYQSKASKKNLILCLIVIFVCIVVVALVLSNTL